MHQIAELSAAPHFPQPLRQAIEAHALATLMTSLAGREEIAIVVENGEIRVITEPAE